MEEIMVLKDENGHEKECEIIAIFKNNNNNYIAYTEKDDKNIPKDLLVSKFEKDGNFTKLLSIDNDEEWDYIEEYLEKEVFIGDDRNE